MHVCNMWSYRFLSTSVAKEIGPNNDAQNPVFAYTLKGKKKQDCKACFKFLKDIYLDVTSEELVVKRFITDAEPALKVSMKITEDFSNFCGP